jgi:hypothetical protein
MELRDQSYADRTTEQSAGIASARRRALRDPLPFIPAQGDDGECRGAASACSASSSDSHKPPVLVDEVDPAA